jgi:hypothetical protein
MHAYIRVYARAAASPLSHPAANDFPPPMSHEEPSESAPPACLTPLLKTSLFPAFSSPPLPLHLVQEDGNVALR